jgi:hypothetical protein
MLKGRKTEERPAPWLIFGPLAVVIWLPGTAFAYWLGGTVFAAIIFIVVGAAACVWTWIFSNLRA